MDKKNVIIVIVLIIVAIVLAIVAGYATFNLTRKDKNDNTNVANETDNGSVVARYTMNTETQYLVSPENEVTQDGNTTTTEPNTGTEVVPSSAVYETNPEAGATDKKQEAIELVKKEWGEDSTVTFRCDHVTENGEYRIAVISKETASVKNYFTVNLQNKTVEVEY